MFINVNNLLALLGLLSFGVLFFNKFSSLLLRQILCPALVEFFFFALGCLTHEILHDFALGLILEAF